MKTVYTTYKIEHLHPDDLPEIDPAEHWVPVERHTLIHDHETLLEMLDEDGNVLNWIETGYDDKWNVISIKEFQAGMELPDKHEVRRYNEHGLIVREESWFAGELSDWTDYTYDSLLRKVKKVYKESEAPEEITLYRYNSDNPMCHTEEQWIDGGLTSEVRYNYEFIRDVWEIIESDIVFHKDKSSSRKLRYFYNGIGPNGASRRTYNHKDHLIEEEREFFDEQDRLVRLEYHTSDSAFSEPFQVEEFKYNGKGVISSATTLVGGKTSHHTEEWFDESGKKLRTHSEVGKETAMYFYVYGN